MRILIVEDEVRLAQALAYMMKEQKYIVDIANDGEEGLDHALTGIYDVIILDVMLPGKNGFEIVRELRKQKMKTPVLLLTARDGIEDKVEGLDSGADYYLTKPFSTDELLACVRALSRRQGEVIMDTLSFSDIKLNLADYHLSCGERSVRLGVKEFEIMRMLLARNGNIVPKEEILVKVWGAETDAEDNNVEVYISFLRKKLFFLKSKVSISTARKIGYYLETESC